MYNGLTRAKKEGWNTPEKSIRGGTAIIAERYIAKGQNTLYLQKFDVVDGGNGYYSHQYMTNLLAAASEAKSMEKTYGDFNKSAITYIIPVYLNMPDTPVAKPTDNGSPYSVLSDLCVEGMAFDKTFEDYTFEYTVKEVVKADSIKISASAYAPGASITGTGKVTLKSGKNTVSVTCKGSDGNTRTYKIHITKEESKSKRSKGDLHQDGVIDVMDALEILRASAKLITLDEEGIACADVNGNGQADAQDALWVLQYITGQRTKL